MEYRKLGDYCEVKGGKRLPKGEQLVEYETNHPYLRISDYSNGSVNLNNLKYVTEETFQKISRYIINEGDIFLSIVGTIGIVDFIDYKLDSASLTENAVRIRSFNESVLSTKFLSYFLKSDQGQNEMFIRTVGSTQPKLAITRIKDINIPIIDIKSQQKISNILSTIDEKITLNKNLIANLEELSQTLFKRWFVDFEFPDENGNPYKSSGGEMVDSELGMIPKGWEIITINDFANNNVITGKTPSTKIKENYSETGIPFLTIPDMHNDIFALNTERYISELGIEKLSKKVLPKNSLSISCIATPGLISIIANDTLTNQQINSFTPSENALYYLYFNLKGMKDYIRDLGSGGSATLNLNKTQFSKIKLVKPINEILYKYDKLVSPNFKMILNIQKEIQQLIQLRDTLLPKLMSGEIEIPDDIEVNEDELSI